MRCTGSRKAAVKKPLNFLAIEYRDIEYRFRYSCWKCTVQVTTVLTPVYSTVLPHGWHCSNILKILIVSTRFSIIYPIFTTINQSHIIFFLISTATLLFNLRPNRINLSILVGAILDWYIIQLFYLHELDIISTYYSNINRLIAFKMDGLIIKFDR